MEIKPPWVDFYTFLGQAYHKTGQYKKERKIYRKAERDFKGTTDPDLFYFLTINELNEGDTVAANRYIMKFLSCSKTKSRTEAEINYWLGRIYSEAGMLDKAEKYYRNAVSLEPELPVWTRLLAFFLIDKELNINEGMELVEKALEINPDSYNNQHISWGFYKQGKYQESLEILQKSWDLRMEKDVYNHDHSVISKQQKRLLRIKRKINFFISDVSRVEYYSRPVETVLL